MEVIEIIKKEVYKRCLSENNKYGIGSWTHHIETVYNIVNDIYKQYKADLEIVSLAALLHDIASVTDESYTEDHHVIGAQIARDLLKSLNYDDKKIEIIEKCILNHRGSILKEKHTPEEICLSDADALAHFYNIPSLLSMVYKEKGLSIDDGAKFVLDKLERSYNKLSEIGKKYIESRYKAARLVLIKK